ncbi:hypothetical protein AMATHDRAFT_3203 [Amanita thiersii Skay4041]|uniref:Uncharacterized protein n=1 Tax=Amanita thiersii Skay4041 TaxID=703135 RepID=A0A2A9NSA2_9AGAR|nr:hypothetical protein AMATHDRAFT_3203 [Amanita thiersii Skay4041]
MPEANKCAITSIIDCYSEAPHPNSPPSKNADAMRKVLDQLALEVEADSDKDEDGDVNMALTTLKLSLKKKKSEAMDVDGAAEDSDGEEGRAAKEQKLLKAKKGEAARAERCCCAARAEGGNPRSLGTVPSKNIPVICPPCWRNPVHSGSASPPTSVSASSSPLPPLPPLTLPRAPFIPRRTSGRWAWIVVIILL